MNKPINFLVAAIRHGLNGARQASPDEKNHRMETCLACEHHAEGVCHKCGCPIDTKTSWASEKCPIRKWLAEKKQGGGGCGCKQ